MDVDEPGAAGVLAVLPEPELELELELGLELELKGADPADFVLLSFWLAELVSLVVL